MRRANRQVLEAVDTAGGAVRLLVLDTTAVGKLPVSVIDQLPDLRRELDRRGVRLWLAGLPPTRR